MKLTCNKFKMTEPIIVTNVAFKCFRFDISKEKTVFFILFYAEKILSIGKYFWLL